VRVPVSVRMTRGCSLRRRVLVGMVQSANIPRPPFGEVRISMTAPIVSGSRRGSSLGRLEGVMEGSEASVAVEIVGIVDIVVVSPILFMLDDDSVMILVGSKEENISRCSQALQE